MGQDGEMVAGEGIPFAMRTHNGRTNSPFALNFFPVTFTSDSTDVLVGRWQSPEHAEALSASIPGLSVWRDPDDGSRLFAWSSGTPLPDETEGLKRVTVRQDESPRLFERLLMDGVERRLTQLGFRHIGKHGYINDSASGGNLLGKVESLSTLTEDGQIGFFPRIEPGVLFTRDAHNRLCFGLTVDVFYTTLFDVSVAEWIAAGLDQSLSGVYVVLRDDSPTAKRWPHLARRVIGCVASIQNDVCLLGNPREPALTSVPIGDISPEPTRENVAEYLKARDKLAYARGEQSLMQLLSENAKPDRRHYLIWALVRRRIHLNGDPAPIALKQGLGASFGDMLFAGPETFPVTRLDGPSYSFNRSGRSFHARVDKGLQEYGPYDHPRKQPKHLRVLVVTPEEYEGKARGAMKKLVEGVSPPRGPKVFTGLRSMYRLDGVEIVYALVAKAGKSPMQRYADALHEAFRTHPAIERGHSYFDLVITVIEEQHKRMRDSENPYFQTKSISLAAEGTPTQAVTIETLRLPDGSLQYALNTLALAVYAKAGGTSHVLHLPDADATVPMELVFGIGRAFRRVDRLGDAEE